MSAKTTCQIVMILFFVNIGVAQADAQQDMETHEKRLFVELARTATLADGILTLHGVDQDVLWFTDRPFRNTGSMSIPHLIEAWQQGGDSFADDPPNAVLSGMGEDGDVAVVLVLMAPQYKNNTLSFRFSTLSADIPDRLSNVSLLIDDDIRTKNPPVIPEGG